MTNTEQQQALLEAQERVRIAGGELEQAQHIMRCARGREQLELAEREWLDAHHRWQEANALLARVGRTASPRHSSNPFRNSLYPNDCHPQQFPDDTPPEAA